MATRKEVEASRKQQLKDGKKRKDIEKGRQINKEKSSPKNNDQKAALKKHADEIRKMIRDI